MLLRECMRRHAERPRWQCFAHILINDTEGFPKLAKFYRQAFCKVDGRHNRKFKGCNSAELNICIVEVASLIFFPRVDASDEYNFY